MLFYDYEFSKMVIQGNGGNFFCLKVKRSPERAAKHTTHELTYHYFLSIKPQLLTFIFISLSHHLLSPQHHLYFRCSSTQTLAALAHLNIIDTILTKHFQQHSAMHIFSPTIHYLLLLQNYSKPSITPTSFTIFFTISKFLTYKKQFHVKTLHTSSSYANPNERLLK